MFARSERTGPARRWTMLGVLTALVVAAAACAAPSDRAQLQALISDRDLGAGWQQAPGRVSSFPAEPGCPGSRFVSPLVSFDAATRPGEPVEFRTVFSVASTPCAGAVEFTSFEALTFFATERSADLASRLSGTGLLAGDMRAMFRTITGPDGSSFPVVDLFTEVGGDRVTLSSIFSTGEASGGTIGPGAVVYYATLVRVTGDEVQLDVLVESFDSPVPDSFLVSIAALARAKLAG